MRFDKQCSARYNLIMSTSDSARVRTHLLYIGDPQSSYTPGVRAIEPPADTRQAVRGNLYAAVELQLATGVRLPEPADGPISPRAQLAERMLSVMQRTYYTVKGSQSSVMAETLREGLRALQAHNDEATSALRADIACAALLGNRLAVAVTGSPVALIATDSVKLFPSNPVDAQLLFDDAAKPPTMYRRTLDSGSVLFLGGSSWTRYVPIKTLAGTIDATTPENSADVGDYLWRQLSGQRLPGLIVIVAGDTPADNVLADNVPASSASAAGTREESRAVDQAPPAAQPTDHTERGAIQDSRALSSRPTPTTTNLLTSVYTKPPIRSVGGSSSADDASALQIVDAARVDASRVDAARGDASRVDVSHVDVDPAVHAQPVELLSEASTGAGSARAADEPLSNAVPPTEPQARWRQLFSPAAGVAERVATLTRGGVQGAQSLLQNVLPDATSKENSEREKFAASGAEGDVSAGGVHVYSTADDGSGSASNPSGAFRAEYEEDAGEPVQEPGEEVALLFTPPQPAQGGRARLFLLLAVLLLALVPTVVLAVTLSQGANANAEGNSLVEQAQVRYLNAQELLDNGNTAGAQAALAEAQSLLQGAVERIGYDARINELSAAIQTDLQETMQVVALYELVEPLIAFAADAAPHRLLVIDQDVYVLDRGRQEVLRYQLDPTGTAVVDEAGEVVLKAGQTVDGVSVGRLVDMAWQPPISGYEDKPNLLVIDRSNNAFRYNARVEGPRTLRFGEQIEWRTPTQINTYTGNVYITDEERGQIYRYQPSVEGYDNIPDSWFQIQTPLDLSGLVATRIDGDIWLLYDEGTLLRYNQGEQVAFSLENSVGLIGEPVDLFVGDSALYIADAAQERVLVYDRDGRYSHQYQAVEGDMLRGLSGIFVDEVNSRIYLLTESGLFLHTLPR